MIRRYGDGLGDDCVDTLRKPGKNLSQFNCFRLTRQGRSPDNHPAASSAVFMIGNYSSFLELVNP
jgi:hypothetical protein